MQRAGATETAANVLRKVFPLVLLLCLAVSGCGSFCVSGFVNGSTSNVKVSNTSCPLIKATGTVIVQIGAASVPSAPSPDSAAFPPPLASPRASLGISPGALQSALQNSALPHAFPSTVQHIFVTLRGVQANPDTLADEDSPAWQELAPGLAAHPVQLDLLAPPPQVAPLAPLTSLAPLTPLVPLTPSAPLTTTSDSRSLDLSASAIAPAPVPADEYRQLRLRLLPRNPAPDDAIPESNACGTVGWNCIVFADGSVRPLEFTSSRFAPAPTRSGPSEFAAAPTRSEPSGFVAAAERPAGLVAAQVRQSGFKTAPELHLLPEPGTGNLFRVLPGEVIQLSIEFDAASSVYFASNAAVHLVPVFRVVSR